MQRTGQAVILWRDGARCPAALSHWGGAAGDGDFRLVRLVKAIEDHTGDQRVVIQARLRKRVEATLNAIRVAGVRLTALGHFLEDAAVGNRDGMRH